MLRQPRTALTATGIGALALVVLGYAALHVGWVHRIDSSALAGFAGLRRPSTGGALDAIANLGSPKPFTIFSALLLMLALLRGRPRLALAVLVVLAGANLTTQFLKPALAEVRTLPDYPITGHVSSASWPSGHATASMSVALCAILIAPARFRPLAAALGAVFAIAVSYALLALAWHFPSDVAGGYLMAATWTALAVALLWGADRRFPVRARPTPRVGLGEALAPVAAVAILGGGVAALIALARPRAVVDYAHAHTSFVVGAVLLGILALALAAAFAVVLTRPGRPPAPTAAPHPGSPPG